MLIKKENLLIRCAEVSDVPLLGAWWRNSELMAEWGYPEPFDITDEKITKQVLSCSDDTFRILIIEVDGKISGEINLHNMGGKTVQIGINICDFSLRNKGYGTKLLSMLVENLFSQKDFSRIILEVNAENIPARRVYEKIGFAIKRIRNGNTIADYELIKENFLLYNLKFVADPPHSL